MRRPPVVVKAFALALLLSATVSGQSPLATLSGDLLFLLLGGQTEPVRAIVRGDVAAIKNTAANNGLPVLRVLDGFVVVQAAPSQLSVFRGLPAVKSISLDNIVSTFTTV